MGDRLRFLHSLFFSVLHSDLQVSMSSFVLRHLRPTKLPVPVLPFWLTLSVLIPLLASLFSTVSCCAVYSLDDALFFVLLLLGIVMLAALLSSPHVAVWPSEVLQQTLNSLKSRLATVKFRVKILSGTSRTNFKNVCIFTGLLVEASHLGLSHAQSAGEPILYGLEPSSGPTSGGSVITLKGQNFVNSTTFCRFGGLDGIVAPLTMSATQLVCESPARAASRVALEVTTDGGFSFSNSRKLFSYYGEQSLSLSDLNCVEFARSVSFCPPAFFFVSQ